MADCGPVPGWMRPLAGLVSRAYAAEVSRRNRNWDAGRGVVTIDCPVISVGNLSVGGTGKTPMVGSIVSWLLEAGHAPAIAMRGYKSRGGVSDEAAEYAARFGDGVPVVAQPDRLEGLLRLFAEVGDDVDCVVLDDGFQHRRIARQLDIVLIDASRDPFSDACLPAGWLREPVGSLARAHAVVVTHAERVDRGELDRLISRIGAETDAPVVVASHRWSDLEVLHDGEDTARPVEWLDGKRVFAACGIGNPDAFVEASRRASGGALAGTLVLRDHDSFGTGTVRRLISRASGCDAIVVTGKDWAKLRRVDPSRWPCAVARPRLRMSFETGEASLRSLVLAAAQAEDPEP